MTYLGKVGFYSLRENAKASGMAVFRASTTEFSFRRIEVRLRVRRPGLYLPSSDGTADTSVPASPPKIMKEAYGIRRPYLEKKTVN